MKHLLVSIIVVVFAFQASGQLTDSKKVFVCTPCGYDCDMTEHSSPGQCQSCGMPYVDKSTIQFGSIDFAEMCRRIASNKDVVLLDVRSSGEFTGSNKDVISFGHFKGAININVTDLSVRLDELKGSEEREIIVYCSHSHRSPQAAYFLSSNGFKNVTNVEGGVSVMRQGFANNSCLSGIFIPHEN